MDEDTKYYKGHSSLYLRFVHAFRGIINAWQKEPNFRIEVLFALIVLVAMFVLELTGVERAVLIVTVGLVLTVEIINSVFERLLDFLHPHFSPDIKHIKDTMAGAVLLVAVVSLAVAGMILIRPLLEFDLVLHNILASFRTEAFMRFAHGVTLLGDARIIFIATTTTAAVLLFQKRYALVGFLAGSVFLGEVLLFFLKSVFARERPLGAELIEVNGYSFPSGHVFLAVVFWLILGYIITRENNAMRFLWIIPGVTIILVALSRIILPVHWFSDLVGGVFIGVLWLLLLYGINKRLCRKIGIV